MTFNSTIAKKLTFQSIEDALTELNSEDRGRYYLCICPECQQNEAFIYKNNPNFVQCNRQNKCGERFKIEYRDKTNVLSFKQRKIEQSYPELTEEQVKALDWLNRALKHIQKYGVSKVLQEGYRGLSEETTKDFIVDLNSKEMVSFMFRKIKPLLNKDYSKNDFMIKRNIVMPIYSEDESVDRILLRSTIDKNVDPKEIELITNPSKETRDFFISIPDDAETIVFTEALLDGLSFREIDKNVGFVSLAGSNKTRNISKFIKGNKHLFQGKNLVLAMDDDLAGWKANLSLATTLDEVGLGYKVFSYPRGVTDPNDYLKKSSVFFKSQFDRMKKSFELSNDILIDLRKNTEVLVVCDSKLDALSIKSVNADVGVIALENDDNISNNISNFLINNEEYMEGKKFVLALSNSAMEEREKFKKTLDILKLKNHNLYYRDSVFNYFQNDRKGLERKLGDIIAFLKKDESKKINRSFSNYVGVER